MILITLKKQSPNKKNIVNIEQFGDSLKIETEKRGDTIIRHFIDLKGISDDSFDNSYTATCIYKPVMADIDTSIKSKHFLDLLDFKIYFNHSIKDECDFKIDSIKSTSNNQEEISQYKELKRQFNDKSFCIGDCIISLVSKIKTNIVHSKTGKKAKSLFIEEYKTEFSGGKNFLLVTTENDTINFIHLNSWMH